MTNEFTELTLAYDTPENTSDLAVYSQLFPVGTIGSQLAKNTGLTDRERPKSLLFKPLTDVNVRSFYSGGTNVHVRRLLSSHLLNEIQHTLPAKSLYDVLSTVSIDAQAALEKSTYRYLRHDLSDYFYDLAVGADGFLAAVMTKTRIIAPISNSAEIARHDELLTIFNQYVQSEKKKINSRNLLIFLELYGFVTENPQPHYMLTPEFGLTPERVKQITNKMAKLLQTPQAREVLSPFHPYAPNSLIRVRYGISCHHDLLNNIPLLGYHLTGIKARYLGLDAWEKKFLASHYAFEPDDSLLEILFTLKPAILSAYGMSSIIQKICRSIPPDFRIDKKSSAVRPPRAREK